MSVTVVKVEASGPALSTFIVNSRIVPTSTGVGSASMVMDRSVVNCRATGCVLEKPDELPSEFKVAVAVT